jgi:hypothetical protein
MASREVILFVNICVVGRGKIRRKIRPQGIRTFVLKSGPDNLLNPASMEVNTGTKSHGALVGVEDVGGQNSPGGSSPGRILTIKKGIIIPF